MPYGITYMYWCMHMHITLEVSISIKNNKFAHLLWLELACHHILLVDDGYGSVIKLSYCLRGPYTIFSASGHRTYDIWHLTLPNGAITTHHAECLSLLPSALLPCPPVDAPNLHYLNHSNASTLHPFKKASTSITTMIIGFTPSLYQPDRTLSLPIPSISHPNRHLIPLLTHPIWTIHSNRQWPFC